MSLFGQKISIGDLLREIPDEELTRIANETQVDYYAKVLTGKLIFYMLLYGLLRIDRLGQRGLSDVLSFPLFRLLFHYNGKKKIAHSSLSERLSVIEINFFRDAYETIYKQLSSRYTQREIAGMYLQRVDSSLVKDVSGKLQEGLTCGNEYKKGKMLKYTLNYDGMFGSLCGVHKEERYASECLALPENVKNHFKKSKDHACVYVLDRGQSSAEAFQEMKSQKGLLFVGRLLENRKLKIVDDFHLEIAPGKEAEAFESGELKQDVLVKLYKSYEATGKNGKTTRRSKLVDETFRVIRFRPIHGKEEILLITNILTLSANQIAQIYRRRWDIEVFFRFLKQELNFSHFLSRNENGIQVVLYMTLITAMLVMIYKKENEIGYKTAIRRMGIEMEEVVLALAVLISGGYLKKVDLPHPP